MPRQLLLHLQALLASYHTITPTESWASAAAIVRQRHVDLLIIDPATEGDQGIERIAQLIVDFPSVAVMVAAVSMVYKLTKRGLHQAVIYNFDDTAERLTLLLDGIPLRCFLPAVVDALRPETAKLPALVQQRVYEALEDPLRFRSVMALARSVHMSRGALYRAFESVGLGSPGRLLVAARLIQVYVYLRDPGMSVRAATAKVKWDDPRTLKRYLSDDAVAYAASAERPELTGRILILTEDQQDSDIVKQLIFAWLPTSTPTEEVVGRLEQLTTPGVEQR